MRLHAPWHWEKRFEFLCTATRATAWTTTAMWGREGLVQVEMDDIDAHVAWTRDADERFHVRAVHVDEPASFMNDVADLFDVAFEEAERVWVSQHETRNLAVCAEFAQVVQVCQTFGCRANCLD